MKNVKKFTFRKVTPVQLEVVPVNTLNATERPHLITPHRTTFYHIFIFENCKPVHWIDFEPIPIKPYSLLFIDKERVHQFDLLNKYKGHVIIFTDDFFCQTENDIRFLHNSILFNDIHGNCLLRPDRAVFNRISDIRNEMDNEFKNFHKSSSSFVLKNLLHNLLLLAEREKEKKGYAVFEKTNDFEYAALFKDLLEKNYKEKKSVTYYARQLALAQRRLGQATSVIFGKLPKQIIDERIMLEAKRLLVYGRSSIKEIAFELGFEEPTNFIKYFRKHTAETPMEFKEKHVRTS